MKAHWNDGRLGGSVGTALALLAAVVVAGACGVIVAYALSVGGGGAAQPSASEESASSEIPPAYEFVPFGAVTTNLAEGRLTRLMRVSITLQVKRESASAIQKVLTVDKKAVFTDWLVTHLSDKRLEDVTGTLSINRLRREIQDGFNAILAQSGDYKVESVLFEEFIVQ